MSELTVTLDWLVVDKASSLKSLTVRCVMVILSPGLVVPSSVILMLRFPHVWKERRRRKCDVKVSIALGGNFVPVIHYPSGPDIRVCRAHICLHLIHNALSYTQTEEIFTTRHLAFTSQEHKDNAMAIMGIDQCCNQSSNALPTHRHA